MEAIEVPNVIVRPVRSYGDLFCIGVGFLLLELCLGGVGVVFAFFGPGSFVETRSMVATKERLAALEQTFSHCEAYMGTLEALSQSQLREQSTLTAPVPVFDAIRVGLSPRSWVKKIEISGERVTIEGNAISERDVLETLARLQGASIFSDVRVDSTRLVRRDELYTHEFIFRAKHGYETVLGKIP
jgi:hypothetical protein